jgi:hypothetical protein
MARARNIKPSFFKNEQLVELPMATRLLFIGLWTLADREGRLEDRPKRIKMEIFPGDSVDVDKALGELDAEGFIHRYEVAGELYIQILAFGKHQNPHHREPPSIIPAPPQSPGPEAHATAPKPGALTSSQRASAPGEAEAGPGQAVLIPDSPSLIPESGEKATAPSTASRLDAGAVNGHDLLDPAVEHIPLCDGTEWPVGKALVAELDRLYPAVDPVQTLREIRGWCIGNPRRRKTKRGVKAFITSWFAREQDKQSRRAA